MSQLSDVTLRFHIVASFVIIDLGTASHMSVVYWRFKLYISGRSASLIIAIIPKAEGKCWRDRPQ
jgi:hypothetical protein